MPELLSVDDIQELPKPRYHRGRFATPRVRRAWYVVCESNQLKSKPWTTTLYDDPLVLFRDERGAPVTLLERCAHRNVPLSLGKCVEGRIECAYHGWQFDGAGQCQVVPALMGEAAGKARRVPRFATKEAQGYIWVWALPDDEPNVEPFNIPKLDDPDYRTIRYTYDVEGSLYSTAENALDVPHTSFLHKGLFRGGPKNPIRVEIERSGLSAQANYIGEPAPTGLIGKLLAPSGGVVTHYDRFIMPCVAQVEYSLGQMQDSHLLISDMLTPLSDFKTRMHASISFKIPYIGWLVSLLAQPIAIRVLKQDAVILKKQTEWVHRFGGEQFVSTDVDVLGAHILKLLRNGEREQSSDDVFFKEISLLA